LGKLVIFFGGVGSGICWGNDESEIDANKFKVNFKSTRAYIVLCDIYLLLAHIASDVKIIASDKASW